MANSPLVQLDKHPEERDVVGRIILAYGELESLLMHVVMAVLNGDTHTAVRSLFRLRSESNRIAVADAISRPWMRQQKLEADYDKAYNAIRHCMKIRNQYAHCTWLGDGDLLRFGSLDEAAKGNEKAPKIVFYPVTLPLLKEQFDYFGFTEHALLRVIDQYQLRTGQAREQEWEVPRPPKTTQPKLDSRGETRFRMIQDPGKRSVR